MSEADLTDKAAKAALRHGSQDQVERLLRTIDNLNEVIALQNKELKQLREGYLDKTGEAPPGSIVWVRPETDLN